MKDKVILITGGTSGIGLALAEEFGKNQARIAFTGRDKERCLETENGLLQKGIETIGIVADAASENDQYRAVAETINKYGRLDILVNNAGISMRALFHELDLGVFKKVMETNFYGTVYASKAALPWILKSKGSIVGISSVAGFKGLPGRTAYSASKFAMEGFLESLETELLKKGVHVLVACPGFTASRIRENALTKDGKPQSESPREEEKMMQPGEVARLIYKAVESRKRRLVMSREGKLSFWLNKFFPAFVMRKVYQSMAAEPGSGLEPL
jgi:short-subunit dehydrogenase